VPVGLGLGRIDAFDQPGFRDQVVFVGHCTLRLLKSGACHIITCDGPAASHICLSLNRAASCWST
jgi:hypothetical protein